MVEIFAHGSGICSNIYMLFSNFAEGAHHINPLEEAYFTTYTHPGERINPELEATFIANPTLLGPGVTLTRSNPNGPYQETRIINRELMGAHPGKKDGDYEQRLAYAFHERHKAKIADPSTLFVDVHSHDFDQVFDSHYAGYSYVAIGTLATTTALAAIPYIAAEGRINVVIDPNLSYYKCMANGVVAEYPQLRLDTNIQNVGMGLHELLQADPHDLAIMVETARDECRWWYKHEVLLTYPGDDYPISEDAIILSTAAQAESVTELESLEADPFTPIELSAKTKKALDMPPDIELYMGLNAHHNMSRIVDGLGATTTGLPRRRALVVLHSPVDLSTATFAQSVYGIDYVSFSPQEPLDGYAITNRHPSAARTITHDMRPNIDIAMKRAA